MGYDGGIGSGKEGDEQIHLFHGMLCYLILIISMFIFTLLFCTYFGIKIEGYARIVSALTVMYYWLIWSLMC